MYYFIKFILKAWQALFCWVHFDVVKLWKYYDIAPISILVLSLVQWGLYSLTSVQLYRPPSLLSVLSKHSYEDSQSHSRLHWKVFWFSGEIEIEYCFYSSSSTALYSSLCTATSPPNSSVQRMRLDHWTSLQLTVGRHQHHPHQLQWVAGSQLGGHQRTLTNITWIFTPVSANFINNSGLMRNNLGFLFFL